LNHSSYQKQPQQKAKKGRGRPKKTPVGSRENSFLFKKNLDKQSSFIEPRIQHVDMEFLESLPENIRIEVEQDLKSRNIIITGNTVPEKTPTMSSNSSQLFPFVQDDSSLKLILKTPFETCWNDFSKFIGENGPEHIHVVHLEQQLYKWVEEKKLEDALGLLTRLKKYP
jgi:hypothetical protein